MINYSAQVPNHLIQKYYFPLLLHILLTNYIQRERQIQTDRVRESQKGGRQTDREREREREAEEREREFSGVLRFPEQVNIHTPDRKPIIYTTQFSYTNITKLNTGGHHLYTCIYLYIIW